MNELLIQFFVKNNKDITSPPVRTAYGILTGWVGILSNLVLCLVKLGIGIFSGSIAISADAVNNLSDAGSSAITLIGFKMAAKPADDEHPFGHGRIEYVAGLVVAIIIVAVGLNFLKTSFERILHPAEITITTTALLILLLTLPVKLWMFFFYRKVARRIGSETIHAVAFDSLSDILTTSLVILSLIVSRFTDLPVDGCAGLLVALFIVIGGLKVIREIINPLLGECPDHRLVDALKEQLLKCEGIKGVHDIILHNYGPNRYFATAHAEVSPDANAVYLHDILEAAEVKIAQSLPIRLLLHCDPFSSQNPELKLWRTRTEDIIGTLDPNMQVYDFRLAEQGKQLHIEFSLLVPRKYSRAEEKLIQKITGLLQKDHPELEIKIELTYSFV